MAAASFDTADFPRHGGAAGTGPLGIHAASRKIGKPGAERKPVIIYMVSPKVIHVEAHEFLPLVQRLTGPDAGKKGSRPSTSGGAGSSSSPASPRQDSEGGRSKSRAAAPVRVKARALNRPAGGPAVSVSVTATRQAAAGGAPAAAAVSASPATGFMFQDLSPLRGAALKGEHPLVSPGWLHHVSDHFLSPGLGSPSAGFLDIFGPLSSQQQ